MQLVETAAGDYGGISGINDKTDVRKVTEVPPKAQPGLFCRGGGQVVCQLLAQIHVPETGRRSQGGKGLQ